MPRALRFPRCTTWSLLALFGVQRWHGLHDPRNAWSRVGERCGLHLVGGASGTGSQAPRAPPMVAMSDPDDVKIKRVGSEALQGALGRDFELN